MQRADIWLTSSVGLVPVRLSLLDEQTVWMVFVSEEKADKARVRAPGDPSSPFLAVEKWMEVLGHPRKPVWVHMKGVPLHVWQESVFRKLGDCLGQTVDVDPWMISTKNLQFKRVKLLMDGSRKLPTALSLWYDEFRSEVVVEEEAQLSVTASSLSCKIRGREEGDFTRRILNFKVPFFEEEFQLMLGRLEGVGHTSA